jgi:predicted nucleic acid-binding protein
MDVTPAILAKAAELAPRELRTLDAIHLATALSASDPTLDFVTYDARLARAATAHGFSVHAP